MKRARGVSLLEMMIGIAILGILFTTGSPMYMAWIQNQQVRTLAESVNSGLQTARAEAIKSNTTVEFVLTNSTVGSGNANSIVPSSSGRNWMVREYRRVSDDYSFVTSAEGGANSPNTILSTTPAGSVATFNGFGRLVANNGGAAQLQQIDIDSTQLSADSSRDLRILVARGGQARLCDPNVSSPDPRRCVW